MVLIAQISDLHLVSDGKLCYGTVDTNELARRAVEAVNRLHTKPDAVVVTGDIIDTAREEDYKLARDILDRLDAPYFLLSGNHDDTQALKRVFADKEFAAGGPPRRLYYAVDFETVRMIVLDTSVPGASHGSISDDQLEFLRHELDRETERPIIVALHHPPIPTGNRWMDTIGLFEPAELAKIISAHDNVSLIMCGHCHRTVFGNFAGSPVIIAPSTGHQLEHALGNRDEVFAYNLEPPSFLLHRWTANAGLTTHLLLVDRFPGPFTFSWENDEDRPG